MLDHEWHAAQLRNWDNSIIMGSLLTKYMPRKDAWVYHMTKKPTVQFLHRNQIKGNGMEPK